MADSHVKACLITNPRSGRGGIDLSDVLTILQANRWEVAVRQKLHGGHATELARDAAQDGCDVVVACGGDGTLSEVVDGLAGTAVGVGVLPGGTENVWAHELGISSRLRVAAMQLVSAERRRVDVGHVTINGRHGQHFLLMAGLGMDGAVIERVSKPLKNRIGPLAVGLAALEALPTFRAVPVHVEMDGMSWNGRVSQVVIGNTRRYGGFTRVTADAFVDDGLLDVCLITAAGPVSAGRQLSSLLLRQRPSAATAEAYRAASITIRVPVALPLQLDGGTVKLDDEQPSVDGMVYTFSLVAQGISVLVPRTYDGELFQHGPLADGLARAPLQPLGDAAKPDKAHRDGGARDKRLRKHMRVVSVGTNTITAIRMRNGRVMTVELNPQTVVADEHGSELPLPGSLANLTAGDLLHVKGKRDGDHDRIVARRITLLGAQGGTNGHV